MNSRVQQIYRDMLCEMSKPSNDSFTITNKLVYRIFQDYKQQEKKITDMFNTYSGIFTYTIYDDEYIVYYTLCTFERNNSQFITFCKPDISSKTIEIRIKLTNGQALNENVEDVVRQGLKAVCQYHIDKQNELQYKHNVNLYQASLDYLENPDWKIKILARALYASFDFVQDQLICSMKYSDKYEVYHQPECMFYQDMIYALNLLDSYQEHMFGLSKDSYAERIKNKCLKFTEKISDVQVQICKKYPMHYRSYFHPSRRLMYVEAKQIFLQVILYFLNKTEDKKLDKEKIYFLTWLSNRLMMRKYGEKIVDACYDIVDYVPILKLGKDLFSSNQLVFIDGCHKLEMCRDNSVKFLIVNHDTYLEAIETYDKTVINGNIKECLDKVFDYFCDIPVDDLKTYIQLMPEWSDGDILEDVFAFLGNDSFFTEDENTLMLQFEKYINNSFFSIFWPTRSFINLHC